MQVLEDVPLAPLTTLGLGGPARRYVRATTAQDVREACSWDGPLLVLGGGSNMVVADEGFPGLVLDVRLPGVDLRPDGTLIAAAGETWDEVVARTVAAGAAGIEALSGIPGRVGATPMQNVGAYGQEVAETIESVLAWDRKLQAEVRFCNAECGFHYRQSRFKGSDRFVILEVTYRLRPGGAPEIRYAELRKAAGESPTLAQVRAQVLKIRRGKGMVVDPADADSRSVGSFFLNPIVPESQAVPEAPRWPAGPGQVKLSAAWLIEHAGFGKGYGNGTVGISGKHTLALVHRGGGCAADLLALASEIRRGVQQAFGVTLTPEPMLVGCSL
ncbi:MAG: UDP-N-acetylmuramate dehydrogenase [Candidatus Xenobia bacterium]